MNRDAIRDLIAGLAGGASSLGSSINRRKERREMESDREKTEQRAEERAMRMLVAKPVKEDTQVVPGTDENGPGIFLVDKQTGTKKRITDEAMAQLTGGPSTPSQPLLRKPGMDMPSSGPIAAPAVPSLSDPDDEHGSTGDPMLPADSPLRRQPPKLGLQPTPRAEKAPTEPRRMPRSVMVDGKSMEVTMDGVGNAYDLAGNKVTGTITPYVPPKDPNLVTSITPEGRAVRAVDRPGVEVAGAQSGGMGAAGIKKAVAGNRTIISTIDQAIAEVEKNPQAFGLIRGIPGVGKYLDPRADAPGNTARGLVAQIGSKQINLATGANMTIHEEPRLSPFAPAVHDPPKKIVDNLRQLRTLLETETVELERGGKSGPAIKPPPTNDPEFDALMNRYAKKPPT